MSIHDCYDRSRVYLGVPRDAMNSRNSTELEVPLRELQKFIHIQQYGTEEEKIFKILDDEYRMGCIYVANPRTNHGTIMLHKRNKESHRWQV